MWPRRVPRRRIIVTLSLFRPFRVMYGLDTETRAQASPIIGPHRLLEPLIGHHPLAPLKQSPRLKSEPNIGTLLYLAQVARFTGGNVPI